MGESLEEARARLKAHFPDEDAGKGEKWEALWKQNDFLPFDRGLPNPALEDLLVDQQAIIGKSVDAAGRRKKAIVPGCGRGYDVLLLASFGYDAYGLEVSESAVQRCIEEEKANGHKYPVKQSETGAGQAKFVNGDFFSDQWSAQTGTDSFDLVYDYTFLSALPPSLRPAWAKRMSKLVSPEGHLVCVEFPSAKDPQSGGPPFALPPQVYESHLSHPGDKIPYLESGHVDQNAQLPSNAEGLQRVAHWQPKRTHEIGKGTDWVSIWAHVSTTSGK